MVEEEQNTAMHLTDYLEQHYYPRVRSECAESTLDSYQLALGHFERIRGDHPLDKYTLKDIDKYKHQRKDKEDIRKTTINIELRSIKAAFSWAFKHDYLSKHPFKGQDFMFKVESTKRSFTRSEIKRLLKQTEGQMIGLVVRLAYLTGMRIGEMSKLTWHDVNLEDRYLSLPTEITKTGKRMIPLGDKAFNVVNVLDNVLTRKRKKNPERYRDSRKEDCSLLQKQRGHGQYAKRSIQQKFRRTMDKAGLPKELTFHCLRHSFATHVLENGGDLYKLSKILGHSSPEITAKFYDHTTALAGRDTVNKINSPY